MAETTNTENTEKQNEWKSRELGALWIKEGRNQKFLSGHVTLEDMPGVTTKVKVVVFSNKGKTENERAPDYVIYRSVDLDSSEDSGQAAKTAGTSQEGSNEEIPASLV